MLAIPLDKQESSTISELYGKAPFFGILDTTCGDLVVIKNEAEGEGPKSAGFLKENGATSTIFYHMGEGVYKSFAKNEMSVYSVEHTKMSIDEILKGFLNKKLQIVNKSNYKDKLDPGGDGSTCRCGCENA
ncbi:NifB/NifX family molybdenum-iron cluster-binding protein [Candidatus Sulfurimonas marisnigri]|uniref:NifB/NifX family molybdenum-iron cluster-binding protein n=1 Tax=Candidatus Sulfurimonas marisnigri TaxID=2740405 RepID=A0A7S7M076_9BACT|nr:NifB/NifX family molybdenum-iron cluster-binding protein [Candidatus Sulfurimonas marisnigri]QOY53809.1 NifB/NifX family molybdenum-iron cluster-binding protein [Candidatus Sulfurimonas marisnigri]